MLQQAQTFLTILVHTFENLILRSDKYCKGHRWLVAGKKRDVYQEVQGRKSLKGVLLKPVWVLFGF